MTDYELQPTLMAATRRHIGRIPTGSGTIAAAPGPTADGPSGIWRQCERQRGERIGSRYTSGSPERRLRVLCVVGYHRRFAKTLSVLHQRPNHEGNRDDQLHYPADDDKK